MMRQIPFDKARTYLEQRSLDLTASFQKCEFFTAKTLVKLCRNMMRNIIKKLEKHVVKHY